jgi:hypothetical protein
MRRWAIVTVLLYAAMLILLTVPLLWLGLGDWWGKHGMKLSLQEMAATFKEWGYWIWLGVLLLGAFLLLLVPVDLSERRLVARRKLLVPILTATFMLANLVFAGFFSVSAALTGDGSFKLLEFFGNSGNEPIFAMLLILAVLWAVWGVVFYRMTRSDEPGALMVRVRKWLLAGSILELLVAIPSHIVVRNKEVCCAPAASFWGITTGISVMLLCFGPGVFFLFAERIARKRPPVQASWDQP